MKGLLLAGLVVLVGCTNADIAQTFSYGSPGEVTCYSGGQIIYHGKSTGKIHSESGSDGWYFQEEGSGKLIRVSGACVIRN